MTNVSRYFPWFVLAAAGVGVVLAATPPAGSDDQMRLEEFGKLPVFEGGRAKPWDTLARNLLMRWSDRTDWKEIVDTPEGKPLPDAKGPPHTKTRPAIKLVLDIMTMRLDEDSPANNHRVFRIDNEQLLADLGLTERDGLRYSLAEIRPKYDKLMEQARIAQAKESSDQDVHDRKALALASHLQEFVRLAQHDDPFFMVPPTSETGSWQSLAEDVAATEPATRRRFRQVMKDMGLPGGMDLAQIRNLDPKVRNDLARRLQAEMRRADADLPPAAQDLQKILDAYRSGDVKGFNEAVARARTAYAEAVPEGQMSRVGFEWFFDQFGPFLCATVLYVVAMVLVCCSWLGWTGPLLRSAFALTVLGLVIHTGGLLGRMYIMDRPGVFVINLYSSAVFIGWGCVLVGLVVEGIFKDGIGLLAGTVLGFLTSMLAYNWAATGADTLEMLRAVLDTNFWLATHVTTVTLGYMATLMAGVVGIAFVVMGVFTPQLTRERFRTMSQRVYGLLCFATLLSFTGTVLGGIWADQSWGRFWGWDPKENGALIIVIWNALVLHARWAGMVKQRGMAILAIVGNIVVAWSWEGVNMLGVGLHAYGSTNSSEALGLLGWIGLQLAFLGVGLVPLNRWRSYGGQRGTARAVIAEA